MGLMSLDKNLIKSNKDSIEVQENLIEIKKSGFSGLGGAPREGRPHGA